MSGETWNEITYKAAEKVIAGGGGTVASPSVVVGNIDSAATDSGAPVKVGGVYRTTLPVLTNGQRGDLQLGSDGSVRAMLIGMQVAAGNGVALSNCTGVTFAGSTPSASVRPLGVLNYVSNGTTADIEVKPNAVSRIPSSANTTNPTSAKAAAGNVHHVNGYNSSATVTYLKLYNKASAPTVGTDTPFMTIALAPTSTFSVNLNALYFGTGIAYGLTTDAADAGTTVVAAGAILGLNVVYS